MKKEFKIDTPQKQKDFYWAMQLNKPVERISYALGLYPELLECSQQHIAELLGLTRETANRVFNLKGGSKMKNLMVVMLLAASLVFGGFAYAIEPGTYDITISHVEIKLICYGEDGTGCWPRTVEQEPYLDSTGTDAKLKIGEDHWGVLENGVEVFGGDAKRSFFIQGYFAGGNLVFYVLGDNGFFNGDVIHFYRVCRGFLPC